MTADNGVERLQRHALGTRTHHVVMGEVAQRVVTGVDTVGEVEIDKSRLGSQRRGDHLHVLEAVATEIALQMRALARTGLDGDYPAGRADAAGREKRIVAVVRADIDERHAGFSMRSTKANSLGSKEPHT